jgi:hypothetical protein
MDGVLRLAQIPGPLETNIRYKRERPTNEAPGRGCTVTVNAHLPPKSTPDRTSSPQGRTPN